MNVLSFDIEDWFHLLDHPETKDEEKWSRYPARIEANLERIFSLLDDSGHRATFFCLGWMAQEHPQLIRRISERGYEVATHSHLHQLAYEQTPVQFREDLKRSIGAISDATGRAVDTYRVPGFSIAEGNLWAFEILAEEGIKVDCSVFPASRGHGGLPLFDTDQPCLVETSAGNLRELPINVGSFGRARFVFSGGGYFRLFPYSLIRYLFRRNDYVMTYFHPRDFDPEQPVIEGLSAARRFKSYVGLRGAEAKLRALLRDFEFIDVAEAVRRVNWDTAQVVKV
jgi:polysaccharide deacetylase family protein (PEP-CTERM system associated)